MLGGDLDLVFGFEEVGGDEGFEGGEEFGEFVGVAEVDLDGVVVEGDFERFGEAAVAVGADDEAGVLGGVGLVDVDLEGLFVFGGGLVGVVAVQKEGFGGV